MSEEELAQLRETLAKTNKEIGDHLRKKHKDGRPSETCHQCMHLKQKSLLIRNLMSGYNNKEE